MPAVILAALGFLPGLAIGLTIEWSPWTLAPLCAVGAFCLSGRRMTVISIAGATGILWGGAALRVREADCRLRWSDGARVTVVAEPRDRSPDEARRPRRYDVREPRACAGPMMVQLPRGDTTDKVLVIVGTWRRDPEYAAGLFPRRAERAGKLVALVAKPVDVPPGPRSALRTGAERRLARLFGPGRWALAAALTVSPDASVPKEERREFARAGLAHILSISGLHVAILAGALIIALRACRVPPDAARIAGTVIVAAYIWMLGFPAPALRSAGLLALWCWARVRQRPPVPGAILAATALVVAVVDPWSLFEPGPWLSFAGVWGCAGAARWWERVVSESRVPATRRRLRWLAPAAVSTGAVLATAPIQMIAFGSVTPIAIVANLVAIPIAAFATPALALALVLSATPGAMAAAEVTASAAGLSLDALEQVASRAASVEWATATVDAPLVGGLAAAALAFWLLRAGQGRRPARHVLTARVLSVGAAVAAGLAWSPLLASLDVPDVDGRLALHFLSVGQGDAAVLRTPRGRWIVIDGGPRVPGMDAGARRVVPYLRRHGARRLALVVASHGDADHLGGLPAVLSSLPADVVIEPGAADGRPLYAEWLADVAKGRSRWHAALAGERFTIDDVTIRVWHPDSATIAARWEANENSVVLTVEYGGFRALFGGDAGLPMEALRAGTIGAVTVLKVGHHGSRTATGEAWLDDLKPAVCVIEVGARNRYGHPDAGTVARLRDRGCGVWRTDRDGDVDVVTDGRSVTVHAGSRDSSFLVAREQP